MNSLWRSPPTGLSTWEGEWQNSAEQQRACLTRRSEMPSIPHQGIQTCPLWLKPTEFLSTDIAENSKQEPSSWHSKWPYLQRKIRLGFEQFDVHLYVPFREYRDAQGPHDEVYTDGSKIDKRVGAAAIINHHFQNGETTCRQLSKRLPNYSTIFAAEATAIILALNYYLHMDPVQHDVIIYSMSCLQAIEGEDTGNPLICHIMNLLWALSDKGTSVRFCWVPTHCGIEGNEIVDQLAKETLDHDINPLTTVHFADLRPLVNSYI